jgi:hypothetical protein
VSDFKFTRLELERQADANQIRELEQEIERLQVEVAMLSDELAVWKNASQYGHPDPCTLGPLCPYCEIERLRNDVDQAKATIYNMTPYRTTADVKDTLDEQLLFFVQQMDAACTELANAILSGPAYRLLDRVSIGFRIEAAKEVTSE